MFDILIRVLFAAVFPLGMFLILLFLIDVGTRVKDSPKRYQDSVFFWLWLIQTAIVFVLTYMH